MSPTDEELETFLDELTRPMFVWRMARAMLSAPSESMRKSAATRRANALKEVLFWLDMLDSGEIEEAHEQARQGRLTKLMRELDRKRRE